MESAIVSGANGPVARVNDVALHAPGEALSAEELRQRACTELLRQAAQKAGLLASDDALPTQSAVSEATSAAIERLLEQSLPLPEPSEEACRRHYAAHETSFRTGERVRMRHILFAVTPGIDVVALRKRAEAALLEARCHDGKSGDRFALAARTLSNCPSGAEGGELGWLVAADVAPELAKEIFGRAEIGVLPRLVHSRFGLHVVEVQERDRGAAQSFDAVRGAVATSLRRHTYVTALRQYLRVLAGEASIEGVDLEGANSPLVQ